MQDITCTCSTFRNEQLDIMRQKKAVNTHTYLIVKPQFGPKSVICLAFNLSC